jgi:hypothetical protein
VTTKIATPLVAPDESNPRKIASAINAGLTGKINAIGSVTLGTGVTSTTVSNPLIGANSSVFLAPQTANAAAEVGNGTIYIKPSDYVEGTSFKLTHANNSQADRTFGYVILG